MPVVVVPLLAALALLCGKPVQAVLNVFLSLMLWIPGIIHAVIVVNNRNADRRQAALIAAQQAAMEAQTAALLAVQQSTPVAPVPPKPPA